MEALNVDLVVNLSVSFSGMRLLDSYFRLTTSESCGHTQNRQLSSAIITGTQGMAAMQVP